MRIRLMGLMLGALVSTGLAAAPVDFTLRDLDGRAYSLSDFRGKWVVVNYWATWCPPCRVEMPELNFFHDAHADNDAVVLGINFEDIDDQTVRQFLDDYLISFPVVLQAPGPEGHLGEIPAMPTTYIVSPRGEVVKKKVGRIDRDWLEATLARLKAAQR